MENQSKTNKPILNQTHRNASTVFKNEGQWNSEPSLTVQGLSEPMSTIIERFQRGQTILGTKVYYDSEVNENFENEAPFKESEYDLTEIDKARESTQRALDDIAEKKRALAKQKKAEEDERIADEILAKRQALLKEANEKKIPNKDAE